MYSIYLFFGRVPFFEMNFQWCWIFFSFVIRKKNYCWVLVKYFSCSSVTSLPHLFIELLLPSKTGLFFSFLPLINFGRTLRRSRSIILLHKIGCTHFLISFLPFVLLSSRVFLRGEKCILGFQVHGSQPLLSRYYCKISCRIILKKFFWRRCISWRQKVSKANCRVVLYCTVIRYNFVDISMARRSLFLLFTSSAGWWW